MTYQPEEVGRKFGAILNSRLPPNKALDASRIWVETILKQYNGKDRHYHTIRHVCECIERLEEYHFYYYLDQDTFDTLYVAIVFHDIVYTTHKNCCNEQESAKFALSKLLEWGLGYQFAMRATSNILDTDHFSPKRDEFETDLIRDIDLAGLADPYEVFIVTENNIRKEYNQYSDAEFDKSRIDFFKLLAAEQRPLFSTGYFRSKFQRQAQKNMERRIKELVQKLTVTKNNSK